MTIDIEQLRSALSNAEGNETFDARVDLLNMAPDLARAYLDLHADLLASHQREADANSRAMKHLRRAEKSEIASANYANFSHEWRQRAEKAEAERDILHEQNRKLQEALYQADEGCNYTHLYKDLDHIRAFDEALHNRLTELVGDVDVDLDAPLSPEDEDDRSKQMKLTKSRNLPIKSKKRLALKEAPMTAPKTITAWVNQDGSTQFEAGTLFPKGVEAEYVRKDAADKVFKALNDLFIAVQDGCLTSEMEMATVMDNAQDALTEGETG